MFRPTRDLYRHEPGHALHKFPCHSLPPSVKKKPDSEKPRRAHRSVALRNRHLFSQQSTENPQFFAFLLPLQPVVYGNT
jgi:hypothetical protein